MPPLSDKDIMNQTAANETIQARRRRLSTVPRACEGCKLRKIRCDRSHPCSNCRTAGITCQKPNPSIRPSVHPGNQTETSLLERIDHLEHRLRVVEQQLANGETGPDNEPELIQAAPDFGDTPIDTHSTDGSPLYEGGPSFTTQSIQASHVAQRTAIGTGDLQSNFNAPLGDLETLLQSSVMASSSQSYRFSGKFSHRQSIRHLPVDLVLAIIQEIKRKRPIFLCSYVINDPSLVERLCQKIYFPTVPISSGDLASMYGILYVLLKEFVILQSQLCCKYDVKKYMALCEQNFNAAIETYDVLAVPSFENIFALVIGFTKAQDEAKALLSYILISAAANQCQMLGYQKESTYRSMQAGSQSENMRRLFWTTYVFEKNLCLLFGRASSMQDHDIDAEYPNVSVDAAIRPWDESFIMGIKLATIQGQIYDKLYASGALKKGHSERTQDTERLSLDIENWRAEMEQIDSRRVNNQKIFELSRYSWDIMYYSTFTSLLRAPVTGGDEGGEISSQCFHVARLSLQSHLKCFGNYQSSGFLTESDYANWVLLFCSFTPFIVVFLHAIASSNASDVQILEEVVESLLRLRKVSSSLERLYRICSQFAQIAKGLVETRKTCLETYDQQTDSVLFPSNGCASMFRSEPLHTFLQTNEDDVNLDAGDLSAILDGWATGVPSGMDLFGGV